MNGRLWISLNSLGFHLLSVLLLSSEESIFDGEMATFRPVCLAWEAYRQVIPFLK